MRDADNLCIKYLMNELEPSEIMMMERAMDEDQDLLIEIECMRRTARKLDDLPLLEPPAGLSENIVSKAVEYQSIRSRHIKLKSLYEASKHVAVAVALIGSISYAAAFFIEDDNTQAASDSATNVSTTIEQANAASFGSINTTLAGPTKLKPWIDKRDVLTVEDKFDKERSAAFDSAYRASFSKLTPVDDGASSYHHQSLHQSADFSLTSAER